MTQANIAEGLHDLVLPISQLNLNPRNYRQGDVELIKGSLERFGQVRPIVVQRSTMNVVAGNHTMKAATELGWVEMAAVLVELDDTEAEAYLVADNRSSDVATNDDAILAPILEGLMLAGKLDGTGWTPDQVDDLMAEMDALPEVEVGTEAGHGITDEALAERFAGRSQGGALRQFVVMFPQEQGDEVEVMLKRLRRAWGMTKMADVVREAMLRALHEPPIEGLTAEEKARELSVTPDPEAEPVEPEEAA